MAYNFICEASREPDWAKLNALLQSYDCLEAFPIIESDDDVPRLALSIPMKAIGVRAYKQFVSAHRMVTKTFGFTVYDLYYGKEVDKAHLKVLKQEIT